MAYLYGVRAALLACVLAVPAAAQNQLRQEGVRPPIGGVGGLTAGETGIGAACTLPGGTTCYPNSSGTSANCYGPGQITRDDIWLSDSRCGTAGGEWKYNADGRRYCSGMANPC